MFLQMPNIKLKSSDDQVFDVDVKVAQQSVTIKTMLEDLGFTEEDEEEPIPLPNVVGPILKKVLEWATYHKDDPPLVEDENSEKRTDDICDWDVEFLKVSHFIYVTDANLCNHLIHLVDIYFQHASV